MQASYTQTHTHIHPLLGALIMANFPKVKSESKTSHVLRTGYYFSSSMNLCSVDKILFLNM